MVTCSRCVLEGPLPAVEEVEQAGFRIQSKGFLVPDRSRVYVTNARSQSLNKVSFGTTEAQQHYGPQARMFPYESPGGVSVRALHPSPAVQRWVNWPSEWWLVVVLYRPCDPWGTAPKPLDRLQEMEGWMDGWMDKWMTDG